MFEMIATGSLLVFAMINAIFIFWSIVTLNRVDAEGRLLEEGDLLFKKYSHELILKLVTLSCFFAVMSFCSLFLAEGMAIIPFLVQTLVYGAALTLKHCIWEIKHVNYGYRQANKLFIILNVTEVLILILFMTNIASRMGL